MILGQNKATARPEGGHQGKPFALHSGAVRWLPGHGHQATKQRRGPGWQAMASGAGLKGKAWGGFFV